VNNEEKWIPKLRNENSSVYTLFARISKQQSLHQGEFIKIPTGVILHMPDGYVAQIYPKPGLSATGVIAVPMLIGSEFKEEIEVVLTLQKWAEYDTSFQYLKLLRDHFYPVIPGSEVAEIEFKKIDEINLKIIK